MTEDWFIAMLVVVCCAAWCGYVIGTVAGMRRMRSTLFPEAPHV